ncbi:MAG: LamG domain-containing protein [Oscillospiraceae bacterium]|nr:LamG domain-containing protein [Oscillospiraceae bacterium]
MEQYNNSGARPAEVKVRKDEGWNFIAVVYSADKTTVYINGEVAAEVESAYQLTDILGDSPIFQIGKGNWGDGEYMTGIIDEFRVYDHALTGEEIETIYSSLDNSPRVEIGSVKSEGETITVTVETVNVPTGSSVYVVAYNGSGITLDVSKAQFVGDEAQVTFPADDTKTVKVFCWESLQGMRPLCEAVEKAL